MVPRVDQHAQIIITLRVAGERAQTMLLQAFGMPR